MSNGKKTASFGSRFGYIMVAAGAAIGLGNIWKFRCAYPTFFENRHRSNSHNLLPK